MSYSVSQNKATQKYIKNNYEEIKIRIPKGKKEQYKQLASKKGLSLNSFVIDLMEQSLLDSVDVVSHVSKVKNVLSSMAIEDMYFSNDFIEKMVKVANKELSSEELRQEVIKQYARY